jgi:hypothetical protein
MVQAADLLSVSLFRVVDRVSWSMRWFLRVGRQDDEVKSG